MCMAVAQRDSCMNKMLSEINSLESFSRVALTFSYTWLMTIQVGIQIYLVNLLIDFVKQLYSIISAIKPNMS